MCYVWAWDRHDPEGKTLLVSNLCFLLIIYAGNTKMQNEDGTKTLSHLLSLYLGRWVPLYTEKAIVLGVKNWQNTLSKSAIYFNTCLPCVGYVYNTSMLEMKIHACWMDHLSIIIHPWFQKPTYCLDHCLNSNTIFEILKWTGVSDKSRWVNLGSSFHSGEFGRKFYLFVHKNT